MSEIEVKLIDIYKKISNIDSENDVDINSEISREVGFDSLGMVDLLFKLRKDLIYS